MKTDERQNINKNKPKFWNILGDSASWTWTTEVFEYSQMWNYMFRNRRGSLFLKNGNLYSYKQWLLKRIHYLSISFWAMVHSRGATKTEADWSWVNSLLICVLGFVIAAVVRLILYKITKRMIHWWSFRQKPSRV